MVNHNPKLLFIITSEQFGSGFNILNLNESGSKNSTLSPTFSSKNVKPGPNLAQNKKPPMKQFISG